MSEDRKDDILAAEQRRADAMLRNDAEALDAILDPRLLFAHATGAIDDKPAYCAKMAAGRIEYLSIAWSEAQITALGDDHALLTGRMATAVKVEGQAKQLDNRVMTVWAKGPDGWRLLVFQSTPMQA